ncbi:mitochondrial fission process protein 1 [Plakobranchus ocellatus]|uniref:Mitochondrial fission process protein 1 n=1 Tax=Plakobranchus ocellatus TaxID=259542 RepID=A0AAV3ZYC5_9GAST|nr:mitochondrial fission process protein 1 [Plakobranchus ocellatus]
MVDDERVFRRPPSRYLGYGIAVRHLLETWNPPLAELSSLLGCSYIAARVFSKGYSEPDNNAKVPVMLDTFIFEGLASFLFPSIIVQTIRSLSLVIFDDPCSLSYQIPLLVSLPTLVLLQDKIDSDVSTLMDKYLRKQY